MASRPDRRRGFRRTALPSAPPRSASTRRTPERRRTKRPARQGGGQKLASDLFRAIANAHFRSVEVVNQGIRVLHADGELAKTNRYA